MTRLLLKVGFGITAAMAAALALVALLMGDALSLRLARRLAQRTRGGVAVMCDLLDRSPPDRLEATRRQIERAAGSPVRLLDRDAEELHAIGKHIRPHEPYLVRDERGRWTIYAGLAKHPKVLVLGPVRWHRILTVGDLAYAIALAVLVSLVVALLLVAPMARRISSLERAASALASGDLQARVTVGGGHDVLDRLAAHFNHMADRIQSMVEAQRTVLERVSHDLRTPVSRIRFNLELLDASCSSPGGAGTGGSERSSQRRIRAIEDDLDEIEHLVDEILTYARLRSASRPLDLQPVPVRQLVENTIAYTPALQSGEVQVEVCGQAPTLSCDERYLRRCLDNLLDNALRHARNRIRVEIQETDDSVLLAVEDDGPGVPEDWRDRIFEPFARLVGHRTGTGRCSSRGRGPRRLGGRGGRLPGGRPIRDQVAEASPKGRKQVSHRAGPTVKRLPDRRQTQTCHPAPTALYSA